ncbi:Flagellar hook-length control protein [Gemmata sp. SH-PL17]|uniref:flagellar hook-length control protein FliK n=1 Tax=Gemmata sp. SH-PL17 TaxID=1630693 RepID=UPI00078E7C71|nr:flagellar hook-length control protein FliK [Gemmata sp. SH-PL17]AMV25033.1 Flagellar hook-length control protein [Gemmata sp. SH-PL17]
MASTVASVATTFPLLQSSATTTTTTTRQTTSRTDSSDPFQTVLSQATNDARAAQAASDAAQAAVDTRAANDAAARELANQQAADQDAADQDAADAAAAQLAATLAAANQLAPINTTPDTATTGTTGAGPGQVPAGALGGTTGELAPPNVPTQNNPLFRQFVSEAAAQNNTSAPAPVTQDTNTKLNANTAATALTTPAVPQTTATTTTTAAEITTQAQTPAATNLASTIASVQPAQKQIVVPQTPIVTGLQPNQPTTGAAQLPTPVVAPQAPVEATALPDVQVGSRPTTAGEQFAQIASAAATITQNKAPAATGTETSPFATLLASTTVPTAAAPAPTTTAPATVSAPATTNALATNALTATALTSPTEINAASVNRAPTQLAEIGELTRKESNFGDATGASSATAAGTFAQALTTQASTVQQPTATVQAPTPTAQVADGIITHAHVIARGGKTEFQIRLDPPELGAVRIRLTSDGDGINGQVVVASDSVRRMIESQLPELRQRLEATGVTVQNLNIATDSGTGAGSDAGSRAFRSETPADTARQTPVATGVRPRPPTVRAPGALDVMA